MKKYIFFLFLLFSSVSFFSCISSKTAALDSLISEYKAPAAPVISIEYKNNSYIVSCSYRGANWIFLNGMELKNNNGVTKKLLFSNTRRNILDSGGVIEIGVFMPAFTDDFEGFLSAGEISARPLAELKTYDFTIIEIKK